MNLTPSGLMPLTNTDLAVSLEEYAALLELSGASYYSARAFRRAAELVRANPLPVAQLVREGRARSLRGIGPGIEARLAELIESGRIAELDELRRTVSPELAAFGRLHGFAPKRFITIGAELGIHTVAELQAAAAEGRLQEVRGVGPSTEAKITAALETPRSHAHGNLRLSDAHALSSRLAAALGGIAAGEPRRWKDSPGRLAIVVPSERPEEVRAAFVALPEIVALLEPDLGVSPDGTPVELVVAPPSRLGTALFRATGSPEYVAALEPLPDAPDEVAIYRMLGLPYAPPELRELPAPGALTGLVAQEEIRGDLHCHSTWSDGKATIREMAEAAKAHGYEYLAICDHTKNVRVVPGLDGDGLRRQAIEIQEVNAVLAPFRILRGVECDILPSGNLDLPDDVLAELDWVQISLHAGQRAPNHELTARVTHAMHHPAARCLSHPTGRIIGHRPENALDLERTIEAALETGVALEVNGLPDRLDLSSDHVRVVIEAGVEIVCSSDAHSIAGLDNMLYAVHTARRGHATTANVVNAKSLDSLLRHEHA
jgi:DNA polymerase (family 10)